MKKLFKPFIAFVMVAIFLTSLTGCSLYNDLQKHCAVDAKYQDEHKGVVACVTCDSLAQSFQKLLTRKP